MGTDDIRLESIAEEAGITKPWVLDAAPEHRIQLPSFFLDQHEVTNGAYFRFVEANSFPILPHWHDGRPRRDQERLPVGYVSWPEADAYCRWLGKRLPTEAEWEKAARGPDGWIYPWGYFFDYRRANVGGLMSGPAPVGSFPNGQSPYGARDMIGNVWEWTADWYRPYPGGSYVSADFGETYRVARGNSWGGLGHFPKNVLEEVKAAQARATYRLYFPPNIAMEDVGFRCAKDAPKKN
ncbi:MAG: SUMF1/EgtB/PvdO family nonheme iron enzyme [Nitrospirae bacterium]|nr:SUMF1/EgtB/PvdO family nonheme iron enzyme [Nitrospirota bacterium]